MRLENSLHPHWLTKRVMAVVVLWSSLTHKARSWSRGSSGYFKDFAAWRFAKCTWDTWRGCLSWWAVMKRALDRFGQRLQSSLLRFGPRKSLMTNLMMWSDRRLLTVSSKSRSTLRSCRSKWVRGWCMASSCTFLSGYCLGETSMTEWNQEIFKSLLGRGSERSCWSLEGLILIWEMLRTEDIRRWRCNFSRCERRGENPGKSPANTVSFLKDELARLQKETSQALPRSVPFIKRLKRFPWELWEVLDEVQTMKRQIEKKDSEIAEATFDEHIMSHCCIATKTFKSSPKCFLSFVSLILCFYCNGFLWLSPMCWPALQLRRCSSGMRIMKPPWPQATSCCFDFELPNPKVCPNQSCFVSIFLTESWVASRLVLVSSEIKKNLNGTPNGTLKFGWTITLSEVAYAVPSPSRSQAAKGTWNWKMVEMGAYTKKVWLHVCDAPAEANQRILRTNRSNW